MMFWRARFQAPSAWFFVFLAAFIAAYLTMVETLKRAFYKRYANRLEQITIPQKGPSYPIPTARLTQNMIAIISLHFENEISTDLLMSDVRGVAAYPIDSDQFVHGLHHLRRAGLVGIDWRRIGSFIRARYGEIDRVSESC